MFIYQERTKSSGGRKFWDGLSAKAVKMMTIMLNTVCRDFHFFAPFLHAFLASNRKINHTSEDHGIRIDSARVLIAITAALSAGKFVKTSKTVSKFQNSIRQPIFQ